MKPNRFCFNTAVWAGAIIALTIVLTHTVSAQNLLVNGGFESGALAPWTYFSNGFGGYDVETPGFSGAFCTKFDIIDGKTNTQLYQDGVRLEANAWYVLDFYAYSNNITATKLPVMVSIHKHNAPFYTYGVQSQVFPVYCPVNYPSIGGTQYRYYKIEFKTTGFAGVVTDARVRFSFPPGPSDFCIDNISLEKVDDQLLHNGGGPISPNARPWVINSTTTGAAVLSTPGVIYAPLNWCWTALQVQVMKQTQDLQLYQTPVRLEPNTRYRLRIDHENTAPFSVYLHKHVAPYKDYGINNFTCTQIGQHICIVEFKTKNFSTVVNDARLRFWLARYAHPGDVYKFYGITLEKIPAKEFASEMPVSLALRGNYPNPFNPTTTIDYALPANSHVSLKIYNMLGEEVATLVDEIQEAGYKSVEWNAESVPSGMYLCRVMAGGTSDVTKLMLMK